MKLFILKLRILFKKNAKIKQKPKIKILLLLADIVNSLLELNKKGHYTNLFKKKHDFSLNYSFKV